MQDDRESRTIRLDQEYRGGALLYPWVDVGTSHLHASARLVEVLSTLPTRTSVGIHSGLGANKQLQLLCPRFILW